MRETFTWWPDGGIEPAADQQALVGGAARWDYAELMARVDAAARELVTAGVRLADRVGVLVSRDCPSLIAVLAVQRAGAAYVPVDAQTPERRMQAMLARAGARLLVLPSVPGHAASAIPPEIEQLVLTGSSQTGTGPALPSPSPDQLAYILFTSGSTGQPKAVPVRHANVAALAARRVELFPEPRPVLLLSWPLSFDGSVAVLTWWLSQAGRLVIATDAELHDPARLADLIERERVTHLSMVPSLYEVLVQGYPEQLATVSSVVVAGERLHPRVVRLHQQRRPGVRLVNEYGPTETTVWATWHEVDPADATAEQVPIGRPLAGFQSQILDEHGEPVDHGVGQLILHGPQVVEGYLDQPDGAAGSTGGFRREPDGRLWYHTGDLVRLRADGLLEFLGRGDEQVKVRGFRVDLVEVQDAVAATPGVTECAATVLEVDGSQTLLAWLAPLDAELEQVRAELARQLPPYAIPQLIPIAALPRTPAGKVDNVGLRERYLAERSRTSAARPADADELAGLICAQWCTILAAEVGPDVSFFDAGGTSLLLMRLQVALAEQDVQVEMVDMFAHPSPTALAAFVRTGARRPTRSQARGARVRAAVARRARLRGSAR